MAFVLDGKGDPGSADRGTIHSDVSPVIPTPAGKSPTPAPSAASPAGRGLPLIPLLAAVAVAVAVATLFAGRLRQRRS